MTFRIFNDLQDRLAIYERAFNGCNFVIARGILAVETQRITPKSVLVTFLFLHERKCS